MTEINLDGQKYKEMKIKSLIINGKEQSGFVMTADQLKGQKELHVTIETEPKITIVQEEN